MSRLLYRGEHLTPTKDKSGVLKQTYRLRHPRNLAANGQVSYPPEVSKGPTRPEHIDK